MDKLKLYRYLLIISVISLVISIAIVHYVGTKQITELFLQENREKLLSSARIVREFFEGNVSRLKLLASEMERMPVLTNNIRGILKAFYEGSHGTILAVQWIDREGSIKDGFPPEHTPYGYSFKSASSAWDFFKRVTESKDVVFSNSVTLLEGGFGITIAYPVRRDGEFVGALCLVVSYAKNLGPRLDGIKDLLIIDKNDERIVYSSTFTRFVGKAFKELFGKELPLFTDIEGSSYLSGDFQGKKVLVLFDKVSLLSRDWYVMLISYSPFLYSLGFIPGMRFSVLIIFLFSISTLLFAFLLLREFWIYKNKLEGERKFTGRALGSINMPLLIMDKAGRVSFANEFARELLGNDIDGKPCPFLSMYLSSCFYHGDLEKKGSIRQEFKLGENRTFEVGCFLIKEASGDVEGVMVLARDITENKKSEHRLWDLARRLERKIWEEHILFEVSKVVVVRRGKEDFIREVTDLIYAYFPTTLAFIAFLEEKWRALKVEKVKGAKREVKDLLILEKGLSKVVDMGEMLYVPDTRGAFSIGKSFGVETMSELVIPLMARGSTFGILFLGSDRVNAFPEEDRNILKAVADVIAIGIDNINLYQRLEDLAITDDLTGLYNRRFFYQRLSEEIARAVRQETNLILMFIDMDNFKAYNDAFGHLAGDKLLKMFGVVLKESIRKGMDYAFRYGGDEFAVILTSTSYDGALKVADRITREFERYEFEVVGLSFGVAEYEKGMTEDNIIAAADIALYEAKRKGGRKVVLYKSLTSSSSTTTKSSADSTYPSTSS
ncbi:MAG: diguanylate cyclase [Synergistetes bacterium]|nr:diguanylate cyclase [Synergistota bacterium]MCX8127395.1 diguanylate cyclase [Synergistota bacterium]MDW8192259.1 diguanylate cyclase [Synergistota bacterium]